MQSGICNISILFIHLATCDKHFSVAPTDNEADGEYDEEDYDDAESYRDETEGSLV